MTGLEQITFQVIRGEELERGDVVLVKGPPGYVNSHTLENCDRFFKGRGITFIGCPQEVDFKIYTRKKSYRRKKR